VVELDVAVTVIHQRPQPLKLQFLKPAPRHTFHLAVPDTVFYNHFDITTFPNWSYFISGSRFCALNRIFLSILLAFVPVVKGLIPAACIKCGRFL
jgi:hypothetical protein